MNKLDKKLKALYCDHSEGSEEYKYYINLLIEIDSFDSAMRDCIVASFKHGPLWDGDVPSKSGRDRLLSLDYMAKIVVKGEDGYNACTHKGASAYRILMIDAEDK